MAVTGTIRSSAAQSSEGARERFTTRRVEASTPRLTVVPYMEGVRRRPIWNEQLSPPPLLGSPVGAAAGARRAGGQSIHRQRGAGVRRDGRRLPRRRPIDRRGARPQALEARRKQRALSRRGFRARIPGARGPRSSSHHSRLRLRRRRGRPLLHDGAARGTRHAQGSSAAVPRSMRCPA